jgi:hypothetical protein
LQIKFTPVNHCKKDYIKNLLTKGEYEMSILKKGTKMTENHEEHPSCCCDCCHCKKIFMGIVVLILAFIAGIMVGNCRQQYYIDMPYITAPHLAKHQMSQQNGKSANQPAPTSAAPDANTSAQLGGYIIEVEQAN